MAGSTEPRSPATPECPICGKLLTRVSTADPDKAGPRRAELICMNGHHIELEVRETQDDPDPAV